MKQQHLSVLSVALLTVFSGSLYAAETIDNRQSTIDNRQSTIDNRQSTIDNRQSINNNLLATIQGYRLKMLMIYQAA